MEHPLRLYVGSYTKGPRNGIHLFNVSRATGELELVREFDAGENPTFLTIDPTGRFLYAVNEVEEYRGKQSGSVSAFAIEERDGRLEPLNRVFSGGKGPCYVSIDPAGRYLFVGNYSGGSAAVLPIHNDGMLSEPSDAVEHRGSSANHKRQSAPHVHAVVPDLHSRHVISADLGTDEITVYRLDPDHGKLRATGAGASVQPGSGPRHIAFHPNGRCLYVITELSSSVITFAYDPESGILEEIGSVSALPEGFSGDNLGADIHVAPSGRFLYASNRGNESIAIFRIDEGTCMPTLIDHQPTGGLEPRGFTIDSTGSLLIVANQHSGVITTFRIDNETGLLDPTGYYGEVSKPACVVAV